LLKIKSFFNIFLHFYCKLTDSSGFLEYLTKDLVIISYDIKKEYDYFMSLELDFYLFLKKGEVIEK